MTATCSSWCRPKLCPPRAERDVVDSNKGALIGALVVWLLPRPVAGSPAGSEGLLRRQGGRIGGRLGCLALFLEMIGAISDGPDRSEALSATFGRLHVGDKPP